MLLEPAQLSASGRPVLVLGEIELLLVSQVQIHRSMSSCLLAGVS